MDKSKLPQKILKSLDNFTSEMSSVYGNGLISIVLYGSAASGEFKPGFSNVNLLVVLNDTRLENLAKSKAVFKKTGFRELNCLFFTPEYINSSTDVFPIEFLDMKENYAVIYGHDLLSGLDIDLKNLRFQCEQELKSKLIKIKNHFLFQRRDKAILQNLLVRSLNSFLHIARNLIRLKGRIPPYLKEAILKEVGIEFKTDVSNLKKVLELKEKKLKLDYRETEALLFDFVGVLEEITRIVDES